MKHTCRSDLLISVEVATRRPCCARRRQTCATFRISEVDAAAGLYTVLSYCGSNWYSVDLMRGFCTCFVGAAGKLCKHASAELLYRDAQICTGYKIVSKDTKLQLFRVATG